MLGVAPDLVDDSKKMVQLWIHEEHRVFKDRLTDVPDREYFDNLLSDMCKEHFKEDFKSLVSTPEAPVHVWITPIPGSPVEHDAWVFNETAWGMEPAAQRRAPALRGRLGQAPSG